MKVSGSRRRDIRVRLRGELAPLPGSDSLVTVGVAVSGPVAIWASNDGKQALLQRDVQPGVASFARSRPADRHPVSLAAYEDPDSGVPSTFVEIRSFPVAHPYVDRVADGSFLVVGGRCRWTRETGPELNAVVVDEHGSILRRGCLGDGLQHVQVAADGTIWAGYFDEGVFGNYGWGGPDGPTPLGAGGIAAWSPALDKVWELDPSEGVVADCYTLNVTADEVVACTYTDFPVIRIAGGRHTVHPTRNVTGVRGIVATADRVGLVGSYDDPALLIVGRLAADQSFVEAHRFRLRTPDGARLPAAELHCRGPEAHFFVGTTWYSFDLRLLD